MSSIRCKSCGGSIQDVEIDYLTCPYCGSRQKNNKGKTEKTELPQQRRFFRLTINSIFVSLVIVILIAVTAGVFVYIRLNAFKATKPPILELIRSPAGACGVMQGDEGLPLGQQYRSCDKRFTLTMQHDGNLVLYMGEASLWATNTVGKNSAKAIMQRDGNFVLYDKTGKPIWATNTLDPSGAYFSVQNDGNLVIYSASGSPIWASHTCCY